MASASATTTAATSAETSSSPSAPPLPSSSASDATAAATSSSPPEYRVSAKTLQLFRDYWTVLAGLPVIEQQQVDQKQIEQKQKQHQQLVQNEDELSKRILAIHAEAMKIYPYRCVKEFRFAEARINFVEFYRSFVKSRQKILPTLRILDFGCCVGTDLRRCIADGFSPKNLFGVEVQKGFVDLGFTMFEDNNQLPRDRFYVADLLANPSQLSVDDPSEPQSDSKSERLRLVHDLEKVGGVHLLYSGSVLHLFNEEFSARVVKIAYGLLQIGKNKSASENKDQQLEADLQHGIFFGRTVGSNDPVKPLNFEEERSDLPQRVRQFRFLHSVATLKKLLEDTGFTQVQISTTEIDMSTEYEPNSNRKMLTFRALMPGPKQ